MEATAEKGIDDLGGLPRLFASLPAAVVLAVDEALALPAAVVFLGFGDLADSFTGVAPFKDGRPLFLGVSGALLAAAARAVVLGLVAATVVLIFAARGGSFSKDNRLGREVAAVSETGLRARLEDGSVASPSETVEARFLAGMVGGSLCV